MMINFNNFGKGLIWKTVTLAGILVLVLVGQDSAEGKRGPRASLLSSTECGLDLGPGEAFLVVTTTLEDKSSGSTFPEVRGGMIQGTYKPQNLPGNVNFVFDEDLIENLIQLPIDVNPDLTITAEFPLCNNNDVIDAVAEARELNGKSTVAWGISGGDGETRVVMNRCTDNPETVEDEGGIRVEDVIDAIEAACANGL
jgi:hypothetical protein